MVIYSDQQSVGNQLKNLQQQSTEHTLLKENSLRFVENLNNDSNNEIVYLLRSSLYFFTLQSITKIEVSLNKVTVLYC
jgi:hypothetical protein